MGFRRQLAQTRPAVTTAVQAWQPTFFGQYYITLIHIVNTGAVDCKVSVFHDQDGATYTKDTALMYEYILEPGGIVQIESNEGIGDYDDVGTIGVQCDVSDAANFTIYGELVEENTDQESFL